MEIVLRDKKNDMNYQLCIDRQDDSIGFIVIDEKSDLQLDFSADIKGWKQIKSFIDDGLWEYEQSLLPKKEGD